MFLRKILLQGLRLKNKAPVRGHGICRHQWIHRASTASWRLALHVCASQGGGCISESCRAACPGRLCPKAHPETPGLRLLSL